MRLREVEESEKQQMMKARQQKLLDGQQVLFLTHLLPGGARVCHGRNLAWARRAPCGCVFMDSLIRLVDAYVCPASRDGLFVPVHSSSEALLCYGRLRKGGMLHIYPRR